MAKTVEKKKKEKKEKVKSQKSKVKKVKKEKKKTSSSESESDTEIKTNGSNQIDHSDNLPNGIGNNASESNKRSRESTEANVVEKKPKKNGASADGVSHRPRTRSMDVDEKKEEDTNPPLSNFNICQETQKQLNQRNIMRLFPIQAETFNHIMDGKDLIGRARTGMGKTLAFALPIIERLLANPASKAYGQSARVIVMAPTRELAKQVSSEFSLTAPRLKTVTIYGGTPYGQQESALRRGIDVVVGTPGRIIDMMERGSLLLDKIEFFVLDEADQMLDMGFKDEMEKVFAACNGKERHIQTLLFSATMPQWVKSIANNFMGKDRIYIDLVGNADAMASKDVQHIAMPIQRGTLCETINDIIRVYCSGGTKRTLIFCPTKKQCDELCDNSTIDYECKQLHGDISQNTRESTLNGFRTGKFKVLVATDVAGRGLDMIVDLVINVEPPTTTSTRADTETYVHRSGRTGRAGRKGICITLYTQRNRFLLAKIESDIKNKFVWKSRPQVSDIMKFSAESALEEIGEVDDKVIPHFHQVAKQLIEENGAENALAAALACMTGNKKMPRERSMLENKAGFVTVLYSPGSIVHNPTAVINEFKSAIGAGADVHYVEMSESQDQAVFDVPESYAPKVAELEKNGGPFSICKELPKLSMRGGGGGGGGGRFSGGRRGSGGGGRFGGGRKESGFRGNRFGGGGRSSGRRGGGRGFRR